MRAAPVVVIALALTAVTWASERTPAPTFGRYEGGVLPHSANYLFTGGSLRLDPDRRVTVRFTGGCAASGSTTSTPIVADQFRFRGDLVGLRRVHATVSGVFLDSRFARLKIDLVGRGCVVGEIERVASLT